MTLQQVKDSYYLALNLELIERMELADYIREYYVPVYNRNLKLIGYEPIRSV